MKKLLLSLLAVALVSGAAAQPARVQKSNPLPVYIHYMPWFETPATNNGNWGYHWTMQNRNPNVIVDASTGKRQIASHFYPLIGPYASSDPDVIEYHLLLMKLSGIDGVLVDWYGTAGSNGDINSLLRNSNALIDRTDETGLKFGLILEDRFTGSVANGQTNLTYARNNYFNRPEYIRYNNAPLLGVFGPITFNQPSQWTSILGAAGQDVEFLSLWDNDNAGANADGQYVWIYQAKGTTDYYSRLEGYYRDRAPGKKTVMGVAYPGFYDFYAEGENNGTSYFYIPHNNGQTLDQTLGLVDRYRASIDLLQLATFNDYGEGTIFEPTQETGFSYLARVQRYTGVSYTEADLRQVLRLYNLRKRFAGSATKQNQLNQAFNAFVALRLADAGAALDAAEGITSPPPPAPTGVGTFYKDCGYAGYAVALPAGDYTTAQLQSRGLLNNDLSSLKINAGYEVQLFNDDNFGGASLTLSGNTSCLASNPLDAGNWNDKVSSLRLRPATTGFSVFLQAEDYSAMNDVRVENTTDEGGGQNVGYLHPGSWLAYNGITFPASGTYTIEYRVACGSGGGRFGAELSGGATQLGLVDVPGTGGWQTWRTISQTVTISAGTYNFGLNVKIGDWNLNWIRISRSASSRPATVTAQADGLHTAAALELYPNPATDRLQLRAAQGLAGSHFRILDGVGRSVLSGPASASLDVAALSPGLYTLILTTASGQQHTRRFIK